MKIALFYYDGFAEFEIVLVGLLFHREHDIISIALENRERLMWNARIPRSKW